MRSSFVSSTLGLFRFSTLQPTLQRVQLARKMTSSVDPPTNLTWKKAIDEKGAFVRKDSVFRDWVRGKLYHNLCHVMLLANFQSLQLLPHHRQVVEAGLFGLQ